MDRFLYPYSQYRHKSKYLSLNKGVSYENKELPFVKILTKQRCHKTMYSGGMDYTWGVIQIYIQSYTTKRLSIRAKPSLWNDLFQNPGEEKQGNKGGCLRTWVQADTCTKYSQFPSWFIVGRQREKWVYRSFR